MVDAGGESSPSASFPFPKPMAFATINPATLEEIRARIDLVDLISSYGVNLRRAGSDHKACCPFHKEKTPSFVVHGTQGYYHCFGCGEKGDAFTFVMKQDGLTFAEAARKLANQCGVKIEEKADPEAGRRARLYRLHAELAAFFRRCLKSAPEAEPARRYLATRRLPEEALESFCVGYAPLAPEALQTWAQKYGFSADEMDAAGVLLKSHYANGRPYNRFGGRLMFTICDRQGRPVAFSGRILTNEKKAAKYVNSPETPIFKKSNVLFGLDKAAAHIVKAPGRCAIVCEGQIDLIRCHSCGFPNTVASQGTAFTEEHVRMVKKCADSVILVFDADGAGRKAAIKTGGEFLAAEVPVRVATLPAGEDPDSLLRDQGPDAFRAALDAAESITRFQVRTLLAAEEHPGSIDAVARVSRAVLEVIAKCPSAVLRATLLEEAARELGVPSRALADDLETVRALHRARPRPVAPPPEPESIIAPAVATSLAGDGRPEDFYIDSTPFEAPELRPQVALPSPLETALCEFLAAHPATDATLADHMARFAPASLFANELTRAFVETWRAGGDEAALEALCEAPEAKAWLEGVHTGAARTERSELTPEQILQGELRQLWVAAVRRVQGNLPAASSPENDRRRLELSTRARQLLRAPWPRASALMAP